MIEMTTLNSNERLKILKNEIDNAAHDTLLTEASLEMESPSCVREKRRYVKHQNEYWEHCIVEQRRAKRLCTSEHVGSIIT